MLVLGPSNYLELLAFGNARRAMLLAVEVAASNMPSVWRRVLVIKTAALSERCQRAAIDIELSRDVLALGDRLLAIPSVR